MKMFSQNVVDPREFLSDAGHGDSLWDSQQNSQAWSYSQNSYSQMGYPSSNSQGNYRNNPCRSASGGSDYWSQSQNLMEPTRENEEDGRFHLKYMNKPPLFSNNKKKEDHQKIRSFPQYVELQKKKTADDEYRNKLDSIAKFLHDHSDEVKSCIDVLKSELFSEFSSISEKMLINNKESSSNLQKVTDEIKQSLEAQKKDAEEHGKTSIQILELKSKIEEKELEISQLRNEISESKLREEAFLEKENAHHERTGALLQKIALHLEKKVKTTDAAVQTVRIDTTDDATQCIEREGVVKAIQTDAPACDGMIQNQRESTVMTYNSQNYQQPPIMQYGYTLPSCNMQYNNMEMAAQGNVQSNNFHINTGFPQEIAPMAYNRSIESRPLSLENRSMESRPLSHHPLAQKIQPLSHQSPAQRPISLTNMSNPSPVATVAPMQHASDVKKENDTQASCIYNVRRPSRVRITSQTAAQKEDPSSIFFFDLTDTESSPTPSADTPEQVRSTPSEGAEPNKQTTSKFDAIDIAWSTVVKRNTVQQSIRTYGKIKKGSSIEWAKKRKSPFQKISSDTSSLKGNGSASQSQIKAKTRVTQRVNLAKRRKEYAENAFSFTDDIDLQHIQRQGSKIEKNKSMTC